MKKLKVYISSQYTHNKKWKAIAETQTEVELISDWYMSGEFDDNPNIYDRFLDQIRQVDVLVLFVFPEDPRYVGALLETGMAMALDKHVIIIGDKCPGDAYKQWNTIWVQPHGKSSWNVFLRVTRERRKECETS